MARKMLIQLRRDTATNWTGTNPTLAAGEIGIDTTNNQIRIGDGTTAWAGLTPLSGGGGSTSPTTTEGDLIYYHSGADARLPIGSNHTVLRSNGTDPAWGQVDLTTDVTGTLPVGNIPTGTSSSTVAIGNDSRITGAEQTANKNAANGYAGLDAGGNIPTSLMSTMPVTKGGTGSTSLTNHGVMLGQGTGAIHVTSAGTAGQVLTSNGASADPTFQAASGGTISPLTTEGDLWYYHTSADARLAIGSSGTYLKSNGTDPVWTAPASTDLSDTAQLVRTTDTGSVTSTMIADGTIVNADINSAAAIAATKISGTAITAADTGTVTSTMIADGTIVNADINSAAAIAATKISGTALVASNNLSEVTAATARTNLGLGTIATQAASAVSITGGTITGITALTVGVGGTGASTLTAHGVLVGNGTSAVNVTSAGSAGAVLTSNGASADPTFQAVPDSPAVLIITRSSFK